LFKVLGEEEVDNVSLEKVEAAYSLGETYWSPRGPGTVAIDHFQDRPSI
jgi:hypothetical protein